MRKKVKVKVKVKQVNIAIMAITMEWMKEPER